MDFFKQTFLPATIAVIPLSLAVVPWGILCGTLCIQANMTVLQAQMMSLIVFAGAAQISGTAIMGAAGSWLSLINSTVMISVRHVLYSATYKDNIVGLPWWKRVLFAFLLTDEMFAVAQTEQIKTGKFDYWYAVVAGFMFYLVWNIATFAGIFFAQKLKNIDQLGFDFAIAATFIAMVVPMIKENKHNQTALLVAAIVSGVMSLLLELMHVSQALMISGLVGMAVGGVLSNRSITHDKNKIGSHDD